jgi:predicted pyridoxine 5'-phosphate oxidase superfamily flavin-nucleotide-binding protein
MDTNHGFSSDVAFSAAVKSLQTQKGSRHAYARMEQNGGWQTLVTPELKQFIEAQTSVFLATASADAQPYIQHRGGPAGFLRVLDERTLGFIDFSGNRQFISSGNLAENPKAQLFLIDYAQRRRIKIWGEASITEASAERVKQMMPPDYKAQAEQVILFRVSAWDVNCPQHIPQRFEASDVSLALAERDQRIQQLEREIASLRSTRCMCGKCRL